MFQKVRKGIALDNRKKLLYFEAYIFLAWGRILKFFPFSKVAPSLGQQANETLEINLDNEIIIKEVSNAIRMMSRYTFWESACLVQAIAAIRMLNRRGVETTLYLGTTKDPEGKMIAHAWVRSGSITVTGGEVKNHFTIVSTFAKG